MEQFTSIPESELEESFDRSSGPGGQNVNKTSTKVTLRHLPTGISVSIQDSRSQFKNRQLARERLLQLLNDRARQKIEHQKQVLERERRQQRKRPHRVKVKILQEKKKRGALKRQRTQKNFD